MSLQPNTQHPAPNTRETNAAVFADSMLMEAEAIARTARSLSAEDVERAVALLAACRVKIIVSGVGKSGFVARKIAATLTSTGTQGVFLHPSDALHGDLGIIGPADVCVLLVEAPRPLLEETERAPHALRPQEPLQGLLRRRLRD